MAGLTTASLVGLEEPEPVDEYYYAPPAPSRFTRWLGLSDEVTSLNALALLSSGLLSITWLVSMNVLQPAVLQQLADVKEGREGTATGNLTLADELVALSMYFIWGLVADRKGVRWIAVAGHLLCGLALFLYPRARSAYPALLLTRMLFATGASALVTSLSAALSGMSALPTPQLAVDPSRAEDETAESPSTSGPPSSARFAGLLGFSTGLGALLAVSVFLPLPAQLSSSLSIPLTRALRWTFSLLACLALFEGLFLLVGLKIPLSTTLNEVEAEETKGWKARLVEIAKELPRGFSLAAEDGEVALGFAGSFVSRASATIITGFLPLLINRYFISHSLCSPSVPLPPSNGSPALPPIKSCREAYILSSILTGSIQLVSLLLSPAIGYISSHRAVSQPLVVAITSLVGLAAFLGFAFLPHGDPRSPIVWLWAVAAGLSQISGIILSLSLVASGRGRLVQKEGGREVAGVLSSAYSVCGGLGILLVASPSGILFDGWAGWPFALVAIAQCLMLGLGLLVWVKGRSRGALRLE